MFFYKIGVGATIRIGPEMLCLLYAGFFRLVLGKEKLKILVAISELYLVFLINLLNARDKKNLFTFSGDGG